MQLPPPPPLEGVHQSFSWIAPGLCSPFHLMAALPYRNDFILSCRVFALVWLAPLHYFSSAMAPSAERWSASPSARSLGEPLPHRQRRKSNSDCLVGGLALSECAPRTVREGSPSAGESSHRSKL